MGRVAVIVSQIEANCATGKRWGLWQRKAVKLNSSIRSRLRRLKTAVAFPITVGAFLSSTWIGCTQSEPPETPPPAPESSSEEGVEVQVPEPPGSLTFTRDIAPIIFRNCSPCHRPGGAGPFDLLNYNDAKTRGRQMVVVAQSRYMPPWQPEPGYGEFIGERRLSDEQIEALERWVAQGSVEGDPADLPSVPKWPTGWLLGPPDLIVTMPRPYTLAAEAGAAGKDVFRTFVLPVPLESMRYVRALELRPGNPKVVHHIVGGVDPTPRSRQRDEQDRTPGFDGMRSTQTARPPGGHILVWTPGRVPTENPEGLAWRLKEGADLVLELHMQPSGRPERVQPSAGLYFSDQAPAKIPFILILGSVAIDIPAGSKNHWIEDNYVLPVEVQVTSLYPHAHFLGKQMEVYARLPDGSRRWLLYIKDWDFNWQDDYVYAEPVSLPRGTELTMRYSYDNSADNVRNPHNPPRRVVYGPNSFDEMGEVWIQMLTRDQSDRATLQSDYRRKQLDLGIAGFRHSLDTKPQDANTHLQLGQALYAQGKIGEAITHYRQALELHPSSAETHAYLANALTQQDDPEGAIRHYSLALELKPDFLEAHLHVANSLMGLGRHAQAEGHYARVVALNGSHAFARFMQAMALIRMDRYQSARTRLEESRRALPDDIDITHALARLLSAAPDNGVRNGQLALQLLQKVFQAQQEISFEHVETLAMAFAETGQFQRAVQMQQAMIEDVSRGGRLDLAELLQENLGRYRREQPCRRPWRENDPVFSPRPGEWKPLESPPGASRGQIAPPAGR